jgi:carboxymethylenebutenolidase
MRDEFSTPRTKEEKIDSLVHLYMDGAYGRRELIRRLARYTGGAAGAAALLESKGLAQTAAQACPDNVRVPEDAPDVESVNVTFPGKGGPIYALLTKPQPQTEPQPAVIVIHENRGLVEHIRDVTRRVARAGFVGLGIDLLSRQGGTHTFENDTLRGQAYGRTVPSERLEDMLSAVEYLQSEGFVVKDRIGTVGFCAGGGNVLVLAYSSKDITAAVPFYGTPPTPLPSNESLTAKFMIVLSETDRNQNRRYPEWMTGMINDTKIFGLHLYQGTAHGFHNDTGNVYNRAAACDAWARTLDFFNTHLRAPRPA